MYTKYYRNTGKKKKRTKKTANPDWGHGSLPKGNKSLTLRISGMMWTLYLLINLKTILNF